MQNYPVEYVEQVEALKVCLKELFDVKPPNVVSVYAFNCEYIGGFRIVEISIHSAQGGCAYQRSQSDTFCLALILACEDYVRTYLVKPFRPDGWECDIDVFADAEWILQRIASKAAVTEPRKIPVAYEEVTLTEEAAEILEQSQRAALERSARPVRRLPAGDPFTWSPRADGPGAGGVNRCPVAVRLPVVG